LLLIETETHSLPFDGQRVDGVFETWDQPCRQPYGQTHPAQKQRGYG